MNWLQLIKIILSAIFSIKGKAIEKKEDLISESEPEEKNTKKSDISDDQSDTESSDDQPSDTKSSDSHPIFKAALSLTLRYEAGYVNDPDDPGGATNKGVTQAVYDQYRKDLHKALKPVKEISDEEVTNIYFNRYWLKANCNKMPPSIATIHFDTSVHSGIRQASKFLQRSVGAADDGIIGSNTLKAMNKAISNLGEMLIVKKYLNQRRQFFENLVNKKPVLKKFLKGWQNRVTKLENEINKQNKLV